MVNYNVSLQAHALHARNLPEPGIRQRATSRVSSSCCATTQDLTNWLGPELPQTLSTEPVDGKITYWINPDNTTISVDWSNLAAVLHPDAPATPIVSGGFYTTETRMQRASLHDNPAQRMKPPSAQSEAAF
jgi:hypothetical protein